ncbi:dipeptidase [Cellulomonas chitinilytica]|uniref:Dipeptidase n=1 Tax=Cellulomonas chitinilytica TaxID=398759 RepID=A0A919P637_9CELL|nr:M20/M25/M40 family metallo-hydrolase [Cellulomonas chitinilytica]GIG23425.1 dipeptidase [Cellulomonas chitinilytica]
MDPTEASTRVAAVLPGVLTDLEELVAIPSIAFPGYPPEPVHAMAARTLELLQEAGFTNAYLADVPHGYPPVVGEIPGPPGSPVVTLYAHYDVQPAPPTQGWTTDPWVATRRDDGRLYGRGAADDKGGLAIHLATLRALDGTPPCTVRLVVEGMEETNSNLEEFVEAHPELFRCDLFVVCDMGNLRVGEPSLTATLRGDVACVVTVSTLSFPLHSGVFGGPAPDAMMALARLLSSLLDDAGDVAVEGVTRFDWTGAEQSEDEFRAGAGLLPGVRTAGTGSISSRLWSRPSVSAIGVDITSIEGSSNVLHPSARAKIWMRVPPGADPAAELDALVRHLETHAPWGAQVVVERTKAAPPFTVPTDGPGYAAARRALRAAYGTDAGDVGSGGSIPLLQTLASVSPGAEFVLWGPEDVALSRIHASDESVDPSEIERMAVAQVLLLEELAAG